MSDLERLRHEYVSTILPLAYANRDLHSTFYLALTRFQAGYCPTIVERDGPPTGSGCFSFHGPRMESLWALSLRDQEKLILEVQTYRKRNRKRFPRVLPTWEAPFSPTDRISGPYVPSIHQLDIPSSAASERSSYIVMYRSDARGADPLDLFCTIVLRQRIAGQPLHYFFFGPNLETSWGLTEADTRKLVAEVERYQDIDPAHQLIGGYVID